MKIPKSLSPTAISLWGADRQEFYLKYLTDNRPPKMPQTQPMSVGSAFDAYVKSYLVERLRGKVSKFEFIVIFEQQVEPHNRDFALEAGKICFEAYKESGALKDLLKQLQKASNEPRFEFKAEGDVAGIPLNGRPDLHYISEVGAHIIVDWKVNGYCSKRGVSPKRGYVLCRDGWTGGQSKSHRTAHKDAQVMRIGDMEINIAQFFEEIDESWARQLSIYAWLEGEEVGSPFVICIEQLACQPGKIRIANHRARSSKGYQEMLMQHITEIWTAIQSGHVFDDLSREANDAKCKQLNNYYKAFEGGTDNDKWFTQTVRQH